MRRLRPTAVIILAVLLVSGCAATGGGTLPELDDWERRQAVLAATGEYEFSGRIGVRAGSDGFNGKIRWRQDGIVYRARVSGPIGVGTVFVNGDGREVTLTDRDGKITELDDAERDLLARYGWTIPVTSLRYWALGVPDPASNADVDVDENGLLRGLEQRAWRVEIDEYAEAGGQPMPRRLTAVSADIRVRLLIDEWAFP